MTIEQVMQSEQLFLSPADIAPILKCDPQAIRIQAHTDPSKLGFRTVTIGSRVRIPRVEFLRFLGVI